MFVALSSGCRKNTDVSPDAKPDWVIAADVNKEFSLTYIVKVSVTNQIQPLLEKDELAAFIGTQCRGTATIVTNDNKNCFYLLIYGNQNDTLKLSFKYYCSQKGRIFESVPIDSYFPNQIVGSVDAPILFEF
jgi:hypothetical protein